MADPILLAQDIMTPGRITYSAERELARALLEADALLGEVGEALERYFAVLDRGDIASDDELITLLANPQVQAAMERREDG
ncbi:MAG: hypothetical protein ACRDGM_19170 [bacterium]